MYCGAPKARGAAQNSLTAPPATSTAGAGASSRARRRVLSRMSWSRWTAPDHRCLAGEPDLATPPGHDRDCPRLRRSQHLRRLRDVAGAYVPLDRIRLRVASRRSPSRSPPPPSPRTSGKKTRPANARTPAIARPRSTRAGFLAAPTWLSLQAEGARNEKDFKARARQSRRARVLVRRESALIL